MEKYKYLFKNVGLLTISNFGSKILTFLLVPLYTNILSTEDYGTYDLYIVTISLLTPVLSLNIIDAVMRFSLDNCKSKSEIFSVGVRNVTRAIAITIFLVGINYYFNIIPVFNEFPLYFILYFSFSLVYDLVTQFAKGNDKVTDFAIAGIINSATMLTLNILFLCVFKMGLDGYFLANCIALLIPIIYLTFRIKTYNNIVVKISDKALAKEMTKYSTPMIFNTIAWWINNVSDRYIITWLCGKSANGIYSVAYKIPSILNVFQGVFYQAWTLSAVKEYNEEGKQFYSNVYKLYNFGMVFVCSVLIFADQLIAKILFAKDFYTAWQYAPFLMISVVFGALSALLGGVFTATKDSKLFAKTTIMGAVVNLILNIVLVHFIGPIGAAIATMISYFLVWVARIISVKKIFSFEISLGKDIICYLILLAQAIIMVVINTILIKYAIEALCIIAILIMYKNELIIFFNKFTDKIKARKQQH